MVHPLRRLLIESTVLIHLPSVHPMVRLVELGRAKQEEDVLAYTVLPVWVQVSSDSLLPGLG